MARRRRLEDAELAPELRRTEEALAAELAVPVRVVVRRTSGDHRAADYLGGAMIALFVLLALTLRPDLAPPGRTPVLVALAFGLGALITARTAGLRRPLSGALRRRLHVITAARAHFVEARLPSDAVLVYLSTFEREVAVVRRAPLTREAEAQLERVREALRVGTPKLVLGAVESMGLYLGAHGALEATSPQPTPIGTVAALDDALAPARGAARARTHDDPAALEPWPARDEDQDEDDGGDDPAEPTPRLLVATPPEQSRTAPDDPS
jgi:hypothetical protein